MSRLMSQVMAVCTEPEPSMERDQTPARQVAVARPAGLRVRGRMIPVCSWCQRVRDEAGQWAPMEGVLLADAGAALTHGVCPECAQKHFPHRRTAA